MEWLLNFMGTFNYELIEFPNGWVFYQPDYFWLLKAIMVVVVLAYMLKGFFSMLRLH